MFEHLSLDVIPSVNPLPDIDSGSNIEINYQNDECFEDDSIGEADSRIRLLGGIRAKRVFKPPTVEENLPTVLFDKINNYSWSSEVEYEGPQPVFEPGGDEDKLTQYDAPESEDTQSRYELSGSPDDDVENEPTEVVPQHLDTIHSGESLVKYYNFDTSKYNKDTEKCVAFWKAITEVGIEPADCPTMSLGEVSSSESVISEHPVEEKVYIWYNILQNLQKHKLDEAALAATGNQCRFCDEKEPYYEFKKKQNPQYSESELRDDEDLTCLNNWRSASIPRRERSSSRANAKSAVDNSRALTYRPFSRSTLVVQEKSKICEHCHCTNDQCYCGSADSSGGQVCTILQMEEIRTTAFPQDLIRSKLPYEILEKAVQDMTFRNIEKCFEMSQYDMKAPSSTKLHSLRTTTDQSNDKKASLTMPKCATCNKIFCQCREHLEKEGEQFVDQLKYELKNIRKDKSCITEKEEEKVVEVKQFCIICGHDNCNCRDASPKSQKYFQFIHLASENEQSNASTENSESKLNVSTEAERISKSPLQKMMSGHIKEDVCHVDQRIDSEMTLTDVSDKSGHVRMTSQLPKKSTDAHTPQNKATKNKDLNTAASNIKYGIPSAQHAGKYVPSKSVGSVEMTSEGNSSEKSKSKGKANANAATKKCQKPMLWYCSDMPQRKGTASLPSNSVGRKL